VAFVALLNLWEVKVIVSLKATLSYASTYRELLVSQRQSFLMRKDHFYRREMFMKFLNSILQATMIDSQLADTLACRGTTRTFLQSTSHNHQRILRK